LAAHCLAGSFSVAFDGVDDSMMTTTAVSGLPIAAADNWTMSVWINPVDVYNGDVFFTWGQAPPAMVTGQQRGILRYGSVIFFWASGSAGDIAFTKDFNLGTWNHVVVTKSGATGYCYHDGVYLKNEAMTLVAPTNATVCIGGPDWGLSWARSTIADPRIWNRALTANEIATIYRTRGRVSPRDGLVFELDNPVVPTGGSMDGIAPIDRSGLDNAPTGDNGGNDTGLTAAGTIIRKRGPRSN